MADRTDYDLTQHQNTSGKDLTYFDQEKNEHYIPYVIEPSLGVERSFLAFLCDAYDEEVLGQDKNGNDDVRDVLGDLHPFHIKPDLLEKSIHLPLVFGFHGRIPSFAVCAARIAFASATMAFWLISFA